MPQNLTEEELEAGAMCPRCHKRATEHLEGRTFECHDCGRTYRLKRGKNETVQAPQVGGVARRG